MILVVIEVRDKNTRLYTFEYPKDRHLVRVPSWHIGANHLVFKNKLRYGCGTGPAAAVRSKSKCL
jgi:hypothetical protein